MKQKRDACIAQSRRLTTLLACLSARSKQRTAPSGATLFLRRWLGLIISTLVSLCCPLTLVNTAQAERPRQPNILFIMADQWRAESFGFADNPDVHTPNFDTLAGQSVRFSNAVATIPVCSPTRAALLTGRRGLSNGVLMNDVPLDPKAVTISEVLAADGYDTGFIGKWHVDGHGRSAFIPKDRRHQFQYWRAMECVHSYNNSTYYADTDDMLMWPGYDAEAQTNDAQEYIRSEKAKGNKPFFLMLSWGPPHEPYETAPHRFRDMYDPEKLTLRPNVPPENAAKARTELAGYYAHCTALDECLGQLLATLKELHIDRDTIVVFTSDHGDMLWSHGMEKKQKPWDESCRVPLMFRYPAQLGEGGKVLQSSISTADIMPTVLGLCGTSRPQTMQGQDFSSNMEGGKDPSDGAAIVMCPVPFAQWSRNIGGREFRAIRTDRYTYARDLSGPWLMFDNQTDPYQINNLADKPEYASLQAHLDKWLDRKLKQTGDRFEPARSYIKKWHYTVDATGTVPYKP